MISSFVRALISSITASNLSRFSAVPCGTTARITSRPLRHGTPASILDRSGGLLFRRRPVVLAPFAVGDVCASTGGERSTLG